MAINTKTLVTFCFTVFFILTFVQCLPMTPTENPGYGGELRETACWDDAGCQMGHGGPCDRFCKHDYWSYGLCLKRRCCCIDVIPTPG
ncbi:hypothetical protein CARUB_v10015902mg [Capsella rubella]|uniref:Knottin scorpion toxin-like domain-containing protein n=1 Tax=Capsella rubella TaxID=81985 RepID=R0I7Z3_9BRAS|nr:hypothetical protein CARUB_v10015902mg [Capsella rubella]